jgi:hypothetical protein
MEDEIVKEWIALKAKILFGVNAKTQAACKKAHDADKELMRAMARLDAVVAQIADSEKRDANV